MRFVSTALAAAAVVLCIGCASDVANRYYSSETYPPKPVSEVALLTDAPSGSYEIIADFQMRNETPEGLRARAAKIGADAVIVKTLGGSYSGAWAGQNLANDYSRIVGTAIRYTKAKGN